uniref:phenylalanine--tRNA ligase n=1 Tax=Corallina officinalis TaxID=35170 RepID=A0A6M3WBZ0_COROI|nr:phenylalanine tRNA synthetase [Corallina officinalis]QJF58633.1 phenylalanine tRNA synthetase [Corallina officinalis]QJF58832.1 phenylalanine tRNA synthetase [Corallina officinalis]
MNINMKISWNCLNQLINLTNINSFELAKKLTLAGFEVENIIHNTDINDVIFELSITANRQDITSLIDIAVEISTITDIPLEVDYQIRNNYIKHKIHIKQLNNDKNFNYFKNLSFCMMQNISLRPNYQLIKNHLIAYDLKQNNHILDIIKFINIKWGQAIAIYTISSVYQDPTTKLQFSIKRDNINTASSQDTIYLNNRNLIEIHENNLNQHKHLDTVILMAYESHKQDNNQKNVTGNFTFLPYTLNAYKEIFYLLNSDKMTSPIIYIDYNEVEKTPRINCRINKIYDILGPRIFNHKKPAFDNNRIIQILKKLNFKVTNQKNTLHVHVPKTRTHDIQREIDIIEEIGRIQGFDTFVDQLPVFQNKNQISRTILINQKIRRILRSIGLHEIINYSLHGHTNSKQVALINPLNKDQKILRNSIIHNLILSKKYNIYQSNNLFEVFEIGKIFLTASQNSNNHEHMHIGGLLGNGVSNRSTWNKNGTVLNWFQAKGHLDEFFERIHAKVRWSQYAHTNYIIQNTKEYTHPKRTIYILHQNKTIGLLSQLNNKIAKSLGTSYKIYIFEINLDELIKTINMPQNLKYNYVNHSPYPKVTRDLSITINKKISMQYVENIIQIIKNNNNEFLESVNLLNEYHDNQNTKTISIRITYRSKNQTLTSEKIKILDEIFNQNLTFALNKR